MNAWPTCIFWANLTPLSLQHGQGHGTEGTAHDFMPCVDDGLVYHDHVRAFVASYLCLYYAEPHDEELCPAEEA